MPKDVEGTLKGARLIFGAITLGVLLFAGVVMVLGGEIHGGESTDLGQPLAIAAGILTALVALPAGLIARRLKFGDAETVSSKPPGRRLQDYLIAKLITAALIEGPTLLWLVGAMLDPSPAFPIGAGVCVLLLLFRFPSRHELEELTQLDRR